MGSAAQTCHLPTNKHSRTARAAIEQEHIFGTAKLTEVVATGFYCPGLVRAHNRGVPKIVDTVLQFYKRRALAVTKEAGCMMASEK